MKRIAPFITILAVFFLCFVTSTAAARDIPALATTDWLAKKLADPALVILDIRRVEYYRAGHIPNAINAFYGSWAFKKVDLYTEIPEMDDLFDMVGAAGIKLDSRIVIVGKTDTPQERVGMARVACTLQYAGIDNVAILDGGHNKWTKENRPLSTRTVKPRKVNFTGKINQHIFVKKDYVLDQFDKVIMLDVRDPSFFAGKKKAEFIEKAGHISGAVNLPTAWSFANGGTFKNKATLAALAAEAVGTDLSKEIITYCDTGKCCPTWRYLMKEVLGYQNVFLYDGSIEEWSRDPDAPMQMQ
jgi:thiosulfate/3-mercaptopyruvate sulfurtransferase